ncbi:hypothetical protein C8A00DRAFT_47135 [Chaetomidium leptoderma]|uniref:Protein kinase domain-containing protein n=1 Tax=Chaetomidium leptoderma TaxID=669021 RepID=A0AAN6VET7_9PEZI|nr:hypothetical protein C8A00DRAFT_47135 [Chaetomidium leptoderma]
MSSGPALKYSHHTLVFLPLEKPEIPERQHLLNDQNHESSRYLRERPKGFIFIRWLQNNQEEHPDAVVGLFASVDRPQELVAIKKLTSITRTEQAADEDNPMAAEVEQSSLDGSDPLVQRQLPLQHDHMEPTSFVKLHACQVHDLGQMVEGNDSEGPEKKNANITLFYKYYNGGTLWDLAQKYIHAHRKVPEGFIWHLISQVGRALSWMHTGHIPSREYNSAHEGSIGWAGEPVNRSQRVLDWNAISHMDAHSGNIWLHYPTDEEKIADPRLEKFTDALPQIILGDFGQSFQAQNDRTHMYYDDVCPDMPEPETLRDKSDLGSALFALLIAQVPEGAVKASPDATDYDLSQWMPNNYSPRLGVCWDKFRRIAELNADGKWFKNIGETTPQDWANFPSNDFAYGTMIAMADSYLNTYAGSDQEESVRWTQRPETTMPYHCVTRISRYHRRDWDTVDSRLKVIREKEFSQAFSGCVEKVQAHIVGAAPPDPPAPNDDSLDSLLPYEAYFPEDSAAEATDAVTAGRATVQPPVLRHPRQQHPQILYPHPTGISWPPIPEEFLQRERITAEAYARRYREKRLGKGKGGGGGA